MELGLSCHLLFVKKLLTVRINYFPALHEESHNFRQGEKTKFKEYNFPWLVDFHPTFSLPYQKVHDNPRAQRSSGSLASCESHTVRKVVHSLVGERRGGGKRGRMEVASHGKSYSAKQKEGGLRENRFAWKVVRPLAGRWWSGSRFAWKVIFLEFVHLMSLSLSNISLSLSPFVNIYLIILINFRYIKSLLHRKLDVPTFFCW